MSTFNELKKNLKACAEHLPEIRVALLGDTATQFLAVAIRGMCIEYGFRATFFEAEYNQIEHQIMQTSSEFHVFHAEIVVVFQSTHKLLTKYGLSDPAEREGLAQERLQFVDQLCQTLHKSKIIYYNYPEIDDNVWGSFASKVECSFIYQLRKLNYELMNRAIEYPNLYICDIASIQSRIGRNIMFQPSIYMNTEMVLSIDALPEIAMRTVDIICAIKGKMKKCIILDLDNTVWGGVIGDDGLEHIQLGHNLGIGKAFSEFQLWVKKLKQRGIIIAICSKNTESIAKEPFEKHPDMILRLDDIAVFMANWNNKVDNIRHIRDILNIGFDAMVFLDDNPFERNMVRQNIQEITVPELPEDPADYVEYLYSLNLFETVSYSSTDSDRTKQYQIEAKRVVQRQSFTNESDFLKDLCMHSLVSGFTKFNVPRIAQLSLRSNQFNLRTIRYTESDIERLSKDDRYHCFSFTLNDKFGDNGLICVIILKDVGVDTLFIDTWFMSCRVLKRGMENFALDVIVDYAKKKGVEKIIGEYIPTEKNKLVENHYLNLGFMPMEDATRKLYQLCVDSYRRKECYITKIEK